MNLALVVEGISLNTLPGYASAQCILYVEDDANDVFFLRHAFRAAGVDVAVRVVNDGQEAMDYLAGWGIYADRVLFPFPTLVLLDLQLPLHNGMEVLEWIRTVVGLKRLVVIMFTSSYHPRDAQQAYELGVNSFIVKPVSIDDRTQFARELKAWWLCRNCVPAICPQLSVPAKSKARTPLAAPGN